MTGAAPFIPLRTDPPPALAPTLWLRSAIVLSILLVAIAVLVADLDGPGAAVAVGIGAYALVAVLLICWSSRAMANVDVLVPPSTYRPRSGGPTVAVLWLVAFATPPVVAALIGRIGTQFPDPDAVLPTSTTIGAVLGGLIAAWAPFRYHIVHAARIGVPTVTMSSWFWIPLTTFVGGLVVLAYAYRQRYGTDEPVLVGVGGVGGLATAVFAWTTWRAVIVFDEVIDLRWERWRIEWERTLADMMAQPPPADRDVRGGPPA